MRTFEWIDVKSVEQATAQLAQTTEPEPVLAKAGGIDLLDLMKEGIVTPARLVNLKTIAGLDGIRYDAREGLVLGAMATLARIDADPTIRSRFIALADAAGHAATPQIRNAATIGGNLLQRPRDWYFRHDYFHSDGVDAFARVRDGENQYHAIFDNATTPLVQASTPATALVAYDASVELVGSDGKPRVVKLADFFLPPQMTETKAAYHKQTERDSYDWPICDVATVLTMAGRTVRGASIVMGWVAPTPRRATESERLLIGQPLTEDLARRAARAAVAGATPLSKNGYKVPVLEAVVRRTIMAAAAS